MNATKAQMHLIRWLKIIGCCEEEVIGIMVMAKTPEMRDELMSYMAKKPSEVTPQDVLAKLEEILNRS